MKENYLKKELYDLLNKDPSIFEFIQSGSLDGIWYWDLENPEMEWMSPKFWETLGYDPEDKKHLASEWQDIIYEDDLTLAIENVGKHCNNPKHPYDQIVRYKHKNGSTVWIRCRGLAIRDEEGKAIRMLGAHSDITDLKKAELELEKYANYDKLTGLPNRRLFFERLDLTIKENQRDRTRFALLFIDLDGFKEINDQYGHAIGDKVLTEIGNRLLKSIRKSDTVARMGGDEFTMIVRHVENKKSIHEFVNKILDQLQEVIQIGSITCEISCSIGVSIYPDNGKKGETLLRNADKSMYQIKRNGKGGIRFSKTSS